MIDITVFEKRDGECYQCKATTRALIKRDLGFLSIFLENDPARAEEFRLAGHLTAPVVQVEENGELVETWSGFNPARIKHWAQVVHG